jgi:hypothetical protein
LEPRDRSRFSDVVVDWWFIGELRPRIQPTQACDAALVGFKLFVGSPPCEGLASNDGLRRSSSSCSSRRSVEHVGNGKKAARHGVVGTLTCPYLRTCVGNAECGQGRSRRQSQRIGKSFWTKLVKGTYGKQRHTWAQGLLPDAGMHLLLTRPWWGRIWVLQEITLPENTEFVCGTR